MSFLKMSSFKTKTALLGDEFIIGLDGSNIKIKIKDLGVLIAPYVPGGQAGYIAVSGNTLPNPTASQSAYTILTAGVYTQTLGGSLTLTSLLNVVSWNGSSWSLTKAIDTLPDASVTTAKLAAGSVTTLKLADASVSTAKLIDAAVTAAKLGDGSVTETKILDGSVTNLKVGERAVSPSRTSFLRDGKNKFNRYDTVLLNARFSGVGAIEVNAAFNTVIYPYRDATPNATYKSNQDLTIKVVEFDSAKNFIKATSIFTNNVVLTASNTAYIRYELTPASFDMATLMIEILADPAVVRSTDYEQFSQVMRTSDGLVIIQADKLTEALQLTLSKADFSNAIKAALKAEKTEFFRTGRNVFNKDAGSVTGFQPNINTGKLEVAAGVVLFDFMTVDPSTTYYNNYAFTTFVAEYDINKKYIKRSSFYQAVPYTTGATTQYVRYFSQFTQPTIDVLQVEKTGVTPYESFRWVLKDEFIKNLAVKSELPDAANIITRTPGKNIFNKNAQLTLNARLSAGALQINASFGSNVYDFSPILPSTSYVSNQNLALIIAEYDKDKVFIKQGQIYTGVPFVTSATGAFYRLQNEGIDPNYIQIEKNAVTGLVPFRYDSPLPISVENARASVPGLSNSLALPSIQYMLKNVVNSIYYQPIQKRFNSSLFSTKTEGSTVKFYEKRATVTPVTSGVLTLKLFDAEFDLIESKTTTTVVSDAAAAHAALKWMPIGDSWTEPGVFITKVLALAPNVTPIGTRRGHPQFAANIVSEGRSGYAMRGYFNTGSVQSLHGTAGSYGYWTPFMQPAGNYRYFGGTQAWIEALAGNTTPLYGTAVRLGFNATTGLRNSPQQWDTLWVEAEGVYKYWDGAAWTVVSLATLAFTFNFGKYMAVYEMPVPDVITILLGINDFATENPSGTKLLFDTFKAQMEVFIASIKSYNSAIKIGICTACSYFPTNLESEGNSYIAAKNRSMYNARELMISAFDNRTAEQVYLIDTGAVVDPDYAFHRQTPVLPFPEYVTQAGYNDQTRTTYLDPIHPDNGYYQIGTKMAAFLLSLA